MGANFRSVSDGPQVMDGAFRVSVERYSTLNCGVDPKPPGARASGPLVPTKADVQRASRRGSGGRTRWQGSADGRGLLPVWVFPLTAD